METEIAVQNILTNWKDPLAGLREAGAIVSGFGDFVRDYYNRTMRLSIEFHAAEKYLRAHILEKETDSGATLIVEYADDEQLQKILSAFAHRQDSVSTENYRELVGAILESSQQIFVETEAGLARLSAD